MFISKKETVQKDTIRIEVIGRDLTEDEKNFLGWVASWCSGILSAKNSGFTLFSIEQLGKSLDACSLYLKASMGR
jgi:hypothetical protein